LLGPSTLSVAWFASSMAFRYGMVVVVVVVYIIIVIIIIIQVNLGQTCLSDPSNVGLKIIYKPSINNL
jgi:hypothetical protein